MTVYCELIGKIEEPLATTDEVQPQFDISSWLSTDQINSVTYSAYDELGASATTDVLNAAKHTNTTTVIKPWIKGGGTNNKQYTVQMQVTTLNAEKRTFYIIFDVRDIGER